MRNEYDFTGAKKNHYIADMKAKLDENIKTLVVEYIEKQANETGVPHEMLLDVYLSADKKPKRKEKHP